MVTVRVSVPSYDQSGEEHAVAVGDHVAWELSILDLYLPGQLLQTVHFLTEFIEPPYPPPHYYPTLVRHGAFVAWWDPGKPVPEHVQLPPCAPSAIPGSPTKACPRPMERLRTCTG